MDDVLTAVLQPPVGLSSGPWGAVQAADREIARQTAVRARAVAAFAAGRPASADRAQGERGAMSPQQWAARPAVLRPVSEWAVQELRVALSLTAEAAEALLARSLTLVHRLPRTLDALEAGALHPGHVWPLLNEVAPIADDALRAEVERGLLAWAAGRVTTPAQLGDKARREVLKRNARTAADDLARVVRQRGIPVRPDRTDGMAVVSALLTTPEAAALYRALGAYADALPDDPGDVRTRGQQMADCLLDLVLRPTGTGLPPVQVTLTVIAPAGALLGGDAPCEIDGQVVPAEMVRALLTALTGHPLVTSAAPVDVRSASTGTAVEPRRPDSAVEPRRPDSAVEGDPEDGRALQHISPAEAARNETEAGELSSWWAEMARRILAGEVDDSDPDPPPEEELLRWLEHDGAPPDECSDDSPADVDPPPGPDRFPHPDAADAGDGWWARADRAVADAGTALLAAQRALGHAHRLVRTAEHAAAADEATWQAGLGAPPPTAGYTPGAALDRHTRARDRRCRFPGCRRRVPHGGQLDHGTPWPAGPTAAGNLAGYCTTDHRGKHQAPGWQHDLAGDGTLTLTTPTGLTTATTPPPY
ncbi:HNH endonuclease signature motif containing protein [Geodermatophilus maliterrae]|uniref:HNH endonuclease n=1 Tax=Geodermatophilus maliterrae TaxID=3162531 RepID=A0ABV3XEQ7_9ACTN